MNIKIRWAAVGFIVMFLYGILIFAFGPLSKIYMALPDQKILTPFSIFVLGLGTGVIGALFFLLLYRLYSRRRIFAVYASIILIALVLILSLIDISTKGDTRLTTIFLTYYLPGSLISIPLQPIIPKPSIFYFIVVTFSWVTWGLLGALIGYLLDRLRQLIKR